MKIKFFYLSIMALGIFFCCKPSSKRNLVPSHARQSSPDYFMTWGAQNFISALSVKDTNADIEGAEGAKLARAILDENFLFKDGGLAYSYPSSTRKDLYFLLDDGWDVNREGGKEYFGSLELNSERFPSYTGTPAERLKKLNSKIRESGWRGIALWICAQEAIKDSAEKKKYPSEDAYVTHYWKTRMEWCKEAGINYWKVDWGKKASDDKFRKMLTDMAHITAPDLIIEHTICRNPLNNFNTSFRNDGEILEKSLNVLRYADIFRTYDVMTQLSVPTTLDRIASLITSGQNDTTANCILDSEDEVYIGSVLGCSLGVVRTPLNYNPGQNKWIDYLNGGRKFAPTRFLYKKSDEIVRAVNWQRIMPATKINTTKLIISEKVLFDSWHFLKGDTWWSDIINKTVSQGAPSVISRGIKLPEVTADSIFPFVYASRNENGSVAIGTSGRVNPEKGYFNPLADIVLNVEDSPGPFGIFGYYKNLTLIFSKNISKSKIWAQDLAGSEAVDISNQVKIQENKLILSGKILSTIGLMAASKNDMSEPGMILVIE